MLHHNAMVAFNIESWIWYSVVLLIAISRLSVSPKHTHAHTQKFHFRLAHMHETRPSQDEYLSPDAED
jgi:hypothetical protein